MESGGAFAEVGPQARDAARAALPRGLAAAARAVIALADAAIAEVSGLPEWRDKFAGLACGAGCTPCCYQMVGVTPAEEALLAEGAAALFPTRRKRLIRNAKDQAARAAGLDPAGYWAAKLPCAALAEDGKCVLHAHRPLACRGFNSADAGVCRRSLDGESVRIPVLAAQFAIWGNAQAGLAQALAEAAIPPGPAPLSAAWGRVLKSLS